jgi:hypothetical protein
MGGRVPQDVKRFLDAYIDSVEQLETLILVSENPERTWTAAEVSDRLKTSRGSVEIRLAALAGHGLLHQADGTFSYAATDATDRGVRELASCFKTRRQAVIESIFTVGQGSS